MRFIKLGFYFDEISLKKNVCLFIFTARIHTKMHYLIRFSANKTYRDQLTPNMFLP